MGLIFLSSSRSYISVMACREWKCRREHASGIRTLGGQVDKSLFSSKGKVTVEGEEPRLGTEILFYLFLLRTLPGKFYFNHFIDNTLSLRQDKQFCSRAHNNSK